MMSEKESPKKLEDLEDQTPTKLEQFGRWIMKLFKKKKVEEVEAELEDFEDIFEEEEPEEEPEEKQGPNFWEQIEDLFMNQINRMSEDDLRYRYKMKVRNTLLAARLAMYLISIGVPAYTALDYFTDWKLDRNWLDHNEETQQLFRGIEQDVYNALNQAKSPEEIARILEGIKRTTDGLKQLEQQLDTHLYNKDSVPPTAEEAPEEVPEYEDQSTQGEINQALANADIKVKLHPQLPEAHVQAIKMNIGAIIKSIKADAESTSIPLPSHERLILTFGKKSTIHTLNSNGNSEKKYTLFVPAPNIKDDRPHFDPEILQDKNQSKEM